MCNALSPSDLTGNRTLQIPLSSERANNQTTLARQSVSLEAVLPSHKSDQVSALEDPELLQTFLHPSLRMTRSDQTWQRLQCKRRVLLDFCPQKDLLKFQSRTNGSSSCDP